MPSPARPSVVLGCGKNSSDSGKQHCSREGITFGHTRRRPVAERRLGGDVEKGRGEAGGLVWSKEAWGGLEKARKVEEGKGGIETTREY